MGEQKRDRSGEPFQNDFTENEGAHPPARDAADAGLNENPSQIDSERDDETMPEFAHELRGTNINKPVDE